jgi:hypothetical protein
MKKSILLFMLFTYVEAFAWENTVTHRDVTETAAILSLQDSLLHTEYELNNKK